MAGTQQRAAGLFPPAQPSVDASPRAVTPAPARRHFAARPREDTDVLLDRLTVTFGQLWSHDMSLEQLERYARLLHHGEADAIERVGLREEEIT